MLIVQPLVSLAIPRSHAPAWERIRIVAITRTISAAKVLG